MDFNSIIFPLHYLKNNYGQEIASGSKTLSNLNDNLRQEESSSNSMDAEAKIYTHEMINDNLKDFIYIPRKNGKSKIPCLLLKHVKAKKIMIYLHGNGEDLMMSR